jgi:hypothetical protein
MPLERPELRGGEIRGHRLLTRIQSERNIRIHKTHRATVDAVKFLSSYGLAVFRDEGEFYSASPGIKFLEEEPETLSLSDIENMPVIESRHWDNIIMKSPTIIVAVSRGNEDDLDTGIVTIQRPAKPTRNCPDWITVAEYKAR